jgi:hypothetical protein
MATVTLPLACGHAATVHAASSVFDFPNDPLHCGTCSTLVMLADDIRGEIILAVLDFEPEDA